MRRAFWALLGVGLGAVVGAQVVRWVGRTKQRYSPPNLARRAGERAEGLGDRLRGAIEAGLEEMVRREAEIRDELNLPSA